MISAGSHYYDLLAYSYLRLAEVASTGIPVTIVPPLFPRTDDTSVFDEGEEFSGIGRIGNVEACLTVPASPYVPSRVSIWDYSAYAQHAFPGKKLPERLMRQRSLPGHLILWWRIRTGKGVNQSDFLDLEGIAPNVKADCCSIIADHAYKAVQLIAATGGVPAITGSWGSGPIELRSRTGLTRGVPTNRIGHLHVVDYQADAAHTEWRRSLPSHEIIKHFSPWSHVILEKLGGGIARVLRPLLESQYSDGSVALSVECVRERSTLSNGVIVHRDGFLIVAKHGLRLDGVLNGLMGIAIGLQRLYRELGYCYAVMHKSPEASWRYQWCVEQMFNIASRFGFSSADAHDLVNFIMKIKPTFGQVAAWSTAPTSREDTREIRRMLDRYDSISQRISSIQSHRDSINLALIKDTYRNPENFMCINNTWPVRLSMCYLVDDYEIVRNSIYVRSLWLFPGIGSSISATERVLGTIIDRSMPSG